MTTALRIRRRLPWAILACLAFSSNALAAEPGGIKIQGLLGAAASASMRDASGKCEEGNAAVCWSLANSLLRAAQISAPGNPCALLDCDDRAASYTELGCAISRHACDGGVADACAAVSEECPDRRGQSLLASLISPGETAGSPPSDSWFQIAGQQPDPEDREIASAPPLKASTADVESKATSQPEARVAEPASPVTAPIAATYDKEGLAVVVAWSDAATGSDPLDAQLVSSVVAQGFRVVARPLRLAPALFLQQERPDCDPWYLRELILELDADLAVCASERQGQLNLAAASLRRDVTRYITLGGADALQVVAGQLAAISLPEIVRPGAGMSVSADLKAIYDGFPTGTIEFPVTDLLSLGVRGGYQNTGVEPTPYLMVGLQARLYFNRYQDGLFLGLHTDWASASYADELISQSVNIVTTGLSAGYRLDLPFHISVTPKVEGLLVNQHTKSDSVASEGDTKAWADPEVEGRATLEVGFKF
jgi:hypothetical protein